MISHSEPILCWCWNEGARTTAPSIRLIREIIDGAGIEVNGYHWARVQRVTDGHPDAATDAALEELYVARWKRRRIENEAKMIFASLEGSEAKKPKPSALSRIWAILRGRG